MVLWGLISMQRAKKELRLEREEWENDNGVKSVAGGKFSEKPESADGGAIGSDVSSRPGEPDLEAGRTV
jgi:hypothetical protein